MKTFSTPELAETWGVSRARVQGWIKAGHVRPSVQQAKGRGIPNLWSLEDAYALGVFVQFVEHGSSLKNAARVTKTASNAGVGRCLREGIGLLYFERGRMAYPVLAAEIDPAQLNISKTLLVINLAEIKRHVDERAK